MPTRVFNVGYFFHIPACEGIVFDFVFNSLFRLLISRVLVGQKLDLRGLLVLCARTAHQDVSVGNTREIRHPERFSRGK